MSKIQFWKRITTAIDIVYKRNLLWLLCQRYNFESESQLSFSDVSSLMGCDCYVKDTILKANHNYCPVPVSFHLAVTAMSKIQFWKRITTAGHRGGGRYMLWLLCQRYNFESESQLYLPFFVSSPGCDCYVKDTILKANHNLLQGMMALMELWLLCQRYNFESESQRPRRFPNHSPSCDCYVKDTILKANHNCCT